MGAGKPRQLTNRNGIPMEMGIAIMAYSGNGTGMDRNKAAKMEITHI